jgi:predicted ATP-binding protein involved in virulence
MSSGEIQIITSMLALSSIVEENSLIIIDEPEISLHPNWQIKFIDLLCAIFKKYPTCHFLIATHSHFLVSDLKPESSSLLALVKDNEDNISPELLNYETYGWTAENILYNIFNVATVRNHYFEMDLRNLLSIISSNTKSRNTLKVKEYIRKFENFNIHNNDPLKLIIKEAKKYLNED